MPQRNCTKINANVVSPNKRITLPITMDKYQKIFGDHRAYREWVDEMITQYPDLLPKETVTHCKMNVLLKKWEGCGCDVSVSKPATAKAKGRFSCLRQVE